jgi:hypothetical protein
MLVNIIKFIGSLMHTEVEPVVVVAIDNSSALMALKAYEDKVDETIENMKRMTNALMEMGAVVE